MHLPPPHGQAIYNSFFNQPADQELEKDFPVVSDVSLIEAGTYDQALRFLHHTLSPAQKAALKKAIRGFDLCDQYVCDQNGNEIAIPSVDLDPLISALTGE